MTVSVSASRSGRRSSSERIAGSIVSFGSLRGVALELRPEPGHVVVLGHRAVGLARVDVRVDQRMPEDARADAR